MKFTILFLVLATAVAAQDDVDPTGTTCEPHGDHWHCPSGVPVPTTPPPAEALTTSTTAEDTVTATGGACEPHGDHWHCPDGVPEPTTPPPAEAATTPAATTPAETTPATTASETHSHDEDDHDHETAGTTCSAHDDHWHCPSGVPEPTTPPAAVTTGATTTSPSNGTTSPTSSAPAEFPGGAATLAVKGGVLAALVGAFAFI
ncbi:hypothetical protein K458DRAFT_384613 [Lentithecium fluviatile CBS 122367]|uniref:Uncharacterized protein n=1 Tax=Lentithecium fluviatile CBS 122367 TaxID=1168545 RepID=A0A6G1JDB0_9PLEO|nr:hypothetical protein K458DRAFT_384613 [Lentithecium fluviatile CBS 122367]